MNLTRFFSQPTDPGTRNAMRILLKVIPAFLIRVLVSVYADILSGIIYDTLFLSLIDPLNISHGFIVNAPTQSEKEIAIQGMATHF